MGFIKILFNLRRGEDDKDSVLKNIRANISFKGANLWILACAIVIASVGLNVNSTAVIIGAMLISPLMGPIVGAGFALGMFDLVLLKRSLQNLLIATVVGLVVSSIYFAITPFKEAQSELISRTAPNIYDVMIAFFGGLVGVIAVTRVEKGNPIPGVAIATALMPPLCTAGFGIATGNWKFFGGALFLYAINCTFICIATFIIVKLLRYPSVHATEKKQANLNWFISLLVVIMIVPSIYFAYVFFKEQQFKKNVATYIYHEFEEKGYTVVYKKSDYLATPKTIEVAFLIKKFNNDELESLKRRLPNYDLFNTILTIRQDSTFLAENRKQMALENERKLNEENITKRLKAELDNYRISTSNFFPEAKILFPDLKNISVAKMQVFDSTDSTHFVPFVIYECDKPLVKEDEDKLREWLKTKLNLASLELYRKGD